MINVAEYMGFTHYIVNKMYYQYGVLNKHYEKEDLLQIAYMTLVQSAKTFDEDGMASFKSYLARSIEYSIFKYSNRDRKYMLKEGTPHKYRLYSLNYEIFCNHGAIYELGEFIKEDDGFEENLINSICLKNILNNLTEEEQKIIDCYYFKDMKQKEVAEEFGITSRTLYYRLTKIYAKLKKAIQDPTKVSCIAM